MDKRSPPSKKRGAGPAAGSRSSDMVQVRQVEGGNAWELVHPRSALARADDIAEVHNMLAAGEAEIATDELRWLLSGCTDFIEAHRLLGEIALADNDLPLARGHFGYAFDIGLAALKRQAMPAPLPYRLDANRAFLEAGKGVAYCCRQLAEPELAADVVKKMLHCDPTDALGVSEWARSP